MRRCRSATKATFCGRSIRSTRCGRRTSSANRTSRTRGRACTAGCTRYHAVAGRQVCLTAELLALDLKLQPLLLGLGDALPQIAQRGGDLLEGSAVARIELGIVELFLQH